jgi:hypothetical protein
MTFVHLQCIQTGVHHALNPDPYRGAFGSDGEKYAKDIQETIEYGTTGRVAGFISEAIQVCRYQHIEILSCSKVSFLENNNWNVPLCRELVE